MQYTIDTTTPAANPGIVLEDAKRQLRILDTDDDYEIEQMVLAAIDYVERLTHCYFITQTLTLKTACFPATADPMVIPIVPVTAINSIKYFDGDNAEQTWNSSNYFGVFNSWSPAQVVVADNAVYPPTYSRPDAVQIELVAGHATHFDVRPSLKSAALLRLSKMWALRGDGFDDDRSDKRLDMAIAALRTAVDWGHYAGAMEA